MRSGSALSLFLRFLLALATSSATAAAPITIIYLVSEWLEVIVVNYKPRQIPIFISINEMSKRKSPTLSFHADTRLLTEEAADITARFPDKFFSLTHDMIVKSLPHSKSLADSLYLPFNLVETPDGSILFTHTMALSTPIKPLAMVLGYRMGLVKEHTRSPVKDVVIAMSVYFGQAKRKGVVQAAQLAGINVQSLINDHGGMGCYLVGVSLGHPNN